MTTLMTGVEALVSDEGNNGDAGHDEGGNYEHADDAN